MMLRLTVPMPQKAVYRKKIAQRSIEHVMLGNKRSSSEVKRPTKANLLHNQTNDVLKKALMQVDEAKDVC